MYESRRKLVVILFGALLLLMMMPASLRADPCEDGIPVVAVRGESVTLELVTDGLDRPLDVTAIPGDITRVFVVEHRGTIRTVRLGEGGDRLDDEPYLDITARVHRNGDSGLIGLAFHPLYSENGFFFVHYQSEAGGRILSCIARFSVDGLDPERADPFSERIIYEWEQPRTNHNGGQLAFGPLDGMLYIASGDGGKQRDPDNNAQNPLSPLGKILRIDVDSGFPYSIPDDNPFADRADVLSEIWALGLRNPWRMAFDPANGDLYLGDVGQGGWEEIDYQPGTSSGGENYEWRVREGDHSHNSSTAYTVGTRVGPILEYPQSGGDFNGVSVTAGVVYRGCRMPDLHGTYFFSDYGTDWIRTFRVDAGGAVADLKDRTAELNAGVAPDRCNDVSAFGVDARGEIYICDLGRKLFRVIPVVTDEPASFVRADSNADGWIDIGDVVSQLFHFFRGVPANPPCPDAFDSNDDGALDVSDPIHLLGVLFLGSGTIPPPLACGVDPTDDDEVRCHSSTCQ